MDYNKVRQLVKKYWNGKTELDEEKQLKDFFSQNTGLPKDLESEKALFDYFKQEESRPVMNVDLTTKLREQWKEKRQTPVKSLAPLKQLIKYAAILIPLLLLGYYLINTNQKQQVSSVQTDTFDDPQKAIAETEKTLLLLSQNMNDGMSKMETFKLFDEVKNSGKFKEE